MEANCFYIWSLFLINIHFSQFWKLGNPRSRGWHIQSLVRTGFLVHKWPFSPGGKDDGALRGLFYTALIPLVRIPPSWSNHLRKAPPPRAITLGIVVQSLGRVWLLVIPWTAAAQALLSFTISQSLLKLKSVGLVMPPKHFILCHILLLLPSVFPSIRAFSKESTFPWGDQRIGASASASVLPMNIRGWFPLGWTGRSPCSPRGSQESSPTPWFKVISSSAFSLFYCPALTSIHDYWENHSFDYMDLCRQNNVSDF